MSSIPQSSQDQHVDPSLGRVVGEIIRENTEVFGVKNKPRQQEPNMFQLLSWVPDHDEAWDFKSNNSQALNNPYSKYKNRIARSNNPYNTEAKDQYKKYHIDSQTGAVLPQFDLEQLEQLKLDLQQQENQHQQRGVPVTLAQQPQIPASVPQEQYNLQQIQEQLIQNHSQVHKVLHQNLKPGVYHIQQEENLNQGGNNQEEQNLSDLPDDAADQQERDEYKRPMPTTDLKKVKSKLLSYKKQAKKLDPVYEKERLQRRKDRINAMGKTTRWLPNTAFTTYYGKPAFENYGMGNIKPAVGGLVYGQYLLSHNVNPHRGNKQPQFIQTHKNALDYGERLPESEPQPPRNCKEEYRLSQKQVQEHINRNPLTGTKNNRGNLKIVKPDLVNSLRFASEENSPDNSVDEETKRKIINQQNKTFKRQSKPASKQQSAAQLQGNQAQKSVQIVEPLQQSKITNSTVPKQPQQQQQSVQQQQVTQSTQKPKQSPVKVQKADEKDRGKFMEEVRRKKANSNKITLKVNEVIPIVEKQPQDDVQAVTQVNQQQPQKQQIVQQDFNEMDPPKGYLEQIQEYELNPQNYKNIPPQWLKRIPFAGKKNQSSLPFRLQDM